MFFSIIIPTFNRTEQLLQCIDQLIPSIQLFNKSDYEIIVSDDAANMQLKDTLEERYQNVTWFKGPQSGPAANRNNGAKQAKGEWLIFLDDDVIPDRNLIKAYRNAIELNSTIQAFEGAIHPDDWKLLEIDMAECPINTIGGCFWSANICISNKVFFNVKGFDEMYLIAAQEDQHFYKKIKIVTNPKFIEAACVIHPVRIISLSERIKKLPILLNNWIFYYKQDHTWLQLFTEAYKSQFVALNKAVSKKFSKSSIVHVITILLLFPIISRNALKYKSIKKI